MVVGKSQKPPLEKETRLRLNSRCSSSPRRKSNQLGVRLMILKRLAKPRNDPMRFGVPMELYNISNYLAFVRGFNLG